MKNNEKEEIIKHLLKDDSIKQIYDDYIIKTIPFENWVRNTLNDLLTPKQFDADVILNKIMRGNDDQG